MIGVNTANKKRPFESFEYIRLLPGTAKGLWEQTPCNISNLLVTGGSGKGLKTGAKTTALCRIWLFFEGAKCAVTASPRDEDTPGERG